MAPRTEGHPARNQRLIDRVASQGCPTLVWTIDLLGGSADLRQEVESGVPLREVLSRWQDEVQPFLAQRTRHLLY